MQSLQPGQSSHGLPVRYISLRLGSLLRHVTLYYRSSASMKLTVKSNFFRLSHPSMFSIRDMLLRATFRYSRSLSLLRFYSFSMMLFWRQRILRWRQQTSRFSIFIISCWCRDISSRVESIPSLCSARFLRSSLVIRDMVQQQFQFLNCAQAGPGSVQWLWPGIQGGRGRGRAIIGPGTFWRHSREFQNYITFKTQNTLTLVDNNMSKHPNLKWAQRKDRVFVEVQLRDAKNEKVDLKSNSLGVEGESDGVPQSFSIELYGDVVPEKSKWSKTGLGLSIVLQKKDTSGGYWPRLTKSSAKNQYITCDWARWIDEEDEAEEGSKGLQGFDPSSYNNFNDSDSDDEKGNLDDLDKEQDIEAPKEEKKEEMQEQKPKQ